MATIEETRFANEEVRSKSGYVHYREPLPISDQVDILRGHWSELKPDGVISKVSFYFLNGKLNTRFPYPVRNRGKNPYPITIVGDVRVTTPVACKHEARPNYIHNEAHGLIKVNSSMA